MSNTNVGSPRAASLIAEAAIRLPEAALPDIVHPVYRAAIDAMQEAEEITGDMPEKDYVAMMRAIASEAIRRARVFVTDELLVETVTVTDVGRWIYDDVLDALSAVERLDGPVARKGHLAVMYAVAAEATCRAANCIESLQLPSADSDATRSLKELLAGLRERQRTLCALVDGVMAGKSVREG